MECSKEEKILYKILYPKSTLSMEKLSVEESSFVNKKLYKALSSIEDMELTQEQYAELNGVIESAFKSKTSIREFLGFPFRKGSFEASCDNSFYKILRLYVQKQDYQIIKALEKHTVTEVQKQFSDTDITKRILSLKGHAVLKNMSYYNSIAYTPKDKDGLWETYKKMSAELERLKLEVGRYNGGKGVSFEGFDEMASDVLVKFPLSDFKDLGKDFNLLSKKGVISLSDMLELDWASIKAELSSSVKTKVFKDFTDKIGMHLDREDIFYKGTKNQVSADQRADWYKELTMYRSVISSVQDLRLLMAQMHDLKEEYNRLKGLTNSGNADGVSFSKVEQVLDGILRQLNLTERVARAEEIVTVSENRAVAQEPIMKSVEEKHEEPKEVEKAEKPVKAVEKPLKEEEKPSKTEEQPSKMEEKPLKAEEKPSKMEEKEEVYAESLKGAFMKNSLISGYVPSSEKKEPLKATDALLDCFKEAMRERGVNCDIICIDNPSEKDSDGSIFGLDSNIVGLGKDVMSVLARNGIKDIESLRRQNWISISKFKGMNAKLLASLKISMDSMGVTLKHDNIPTLASAMRRHGA